MVSYDVSALFTSIPVDQALTIIERRLKGETTVKDRFGLTVEQVMALLDICLNTTYFVWDGKVYRQTHGAAMGSPISPIVANLYMEDFEEKAIRTAPHPPDIWLRYVDDTFTVVHEYNIEEFTAHINAIDPHIQFTFEVEEESKLSFLDVQIVLKDDGSLKTQVYRKPTHTDQYLNWHSNHPLEHKRSVVRTLMQRVDNIVSSEEDKQDEINHIQQALAANAYEPWIFKIPQKEKKKENQNTVRGVSHHTPIGVPYVKGLSETVVRLLKTEGINAYHKPYNTLRSMLVKPKDRTPKGELSGLVYHIKCANCDHHYVGETARNLETRFKEHTTRKSTNSTVKEHLEVEGHSCNIEDVIILEKEDNWYRRRVKEAIHIRRLQPTLNRDSGFELAAAYSTLFSRDSQESREPQSQSTEH